MPKQIGATLGWISLQPMEFTASISSPLQKQFSLVLLPYELLSLHLHRLTSFHHLGNSVCRSHLWGCPQSSPGTWKSRCLYLPCCSLSKKGCALCYRGVFLTFFQVFSFSFSLDPPNVVASAVVQLDHTWPSSWLGDSWLNDRPLCLDHEMVLKHNTLGIKKFWLVSFLVRRGWAWPESGNLEFFSLGGTSFSLLRD